MRTMVMRVTAWFFAMIVGLFCPGATSLRAQFSVPANMLITIQSVTTHTIRDPDTGKIDTVRVATGGTLRLWDYGGAWSQMYRVRLDAPGYNRPIFVEWQMQDRTLTGISHYDWSDAISTLFRIRLAKDYKSCKAEAWLGRKTGVSNVLTYEITGRRVELLATRFAPAYCAIQPIS